MVVPSTTAMQIVQGTKIAKNGACTGKATFDIDGHQYHLSANQWCGRIRPAGSRISGQLKGLTDDKKLGHHTWIVLGEAFLQSFYTAFDNSDPKAPRIGLAPVCKQSQVMCVGKERLCKSNADIRALCPIACGLCGQDKEQTLDATQFDP